jgi:hypothetical protein
MACIALIVTGSTLANAESQDFLRRVSLREVKADLKATLEELFRGTSALTDSRLVAVEKSTWQTFQALPKNAAGRLAPPAVRYIVHNYFAKEHGWLIAGLEPHGMQLNASEVHDVSILQDKAPLLVENLLESRHADHGLAFNEVVAMVAVLEQLMFDESITLLHAAYSLNGVPIHEKISEDMLHLILRSYLILFGQGSKANLKDAHLHQLLVQSRERPELAEFEHDAVLNFEFARRHQMNPFIRRQYSFQAAAEIMENMAQQYGKWQNSECRDMRSHLVELDPEGLGRVPLGLFYAQPQGSVYHFTESVEYLRKTGALDETVPGKPQVVIANYVAGPSNCIASSSYYSVCCLSECEHIFGDLEKRIAAPMASPDRLLTLIVNMSSQGIPQGLPEKLHAIAARHNGQIPLHGRLFAQWLHFAFPHDCPYPSIVESSTALTASEWLDAGKSASYDERQQHIESSLASSVPVADDFEINHRWSDHEVLPVLGQPRPSVFHLNAGLVRALVQLAALCVVFRSAIGAWRSISPLRDGAAKKDDDNVFSIRV